MAGLNIVDRIRSAVNAFRNRDPLQNTTQDFGSRSAKPPHRNRLGYGNERSIVTSVFTRVAIDVSSIMIRHARADENGNYIETIDSGLNRCLSLESNIDQTPRSLIQDCVMSLFDEGSVAIVPVDTTVGINGSGAFDVITMRTGKIVEWYPKSIRISVYNDNTGQREEITLPKSNVAIIENPLYAVMNERNSTLQRLISKLNLLDSIDKQSGSGKLDIIVQVPYVIKTEGRRKMAEQRRDDMEAQLADSKYGIAYADATEKIVQLNRPADNNLMGQIEYLTRMLYSQLGMTETIFDGTADEQTMLNYYSRTIKPVISAITEEMKRKFLTQTAITQGQTVMHFRDTFSLVTAKDLADLADKLTRNAIVSSNEFRAVMGMKPSKSPGADDLSNKNIAPPTSDPTPTNTN